MARLKAGAPNKKLMEQGMSGEMMTFSDDVVTIEAGLPSREIISVVRWGRHVPPPWQAMREWISIDVSDGKPIPRENRHP